MSDVTMNEMATQAGTSPEVPASREPTAEIWRCVDCEQEFDEAQERFDLPHGTVCWECWDVRYRR